MKPAQKGSVPKFLSIAMDNDDKNHFKVAYARHLITLNKLPQDKAKSKIHWDQLHLKLIDLDQKWLAVKPADMHTGNLLIHRGNSMLNKWKCRHSDVARVMVQERECMQGSDEKDVTQDMNRSFTESQSSSEQQVERSPLGFKNDDLLEEVK
jgi:hypothetical protein